VFDPVRFAPIFVVRKAHPFAPSLVDRIASLSHTQTFLASSPLMHSSLPHDGTAMPLNSIVLFFFAFESVQSFTPSETFFAIYTCLVITTIPSVSFHSN
jgi:hypothetical protein